MTDDDKKITSLSSFRAKKTETSEEDTEHPMGPKDSPELVPGFGDMPKRAQEKVIEAYANAQGFMEYAQQHADEIMEIATTLREHPDLRDRKSGILVAALILNACAGCQFLDIAGPEAAIIFSSFYNQLVTVEKPPPRTEEKDKPN
jgi:hypothetical protein